jgi:hypothetical protein
MKLRISVLLLMFFISADAQKLPNIAVKPTPKFENPSFCAKEGLINSAFDDAELNMAKNRIDKATKYHAVDYDEVVNLDNSELGKKNRSKLSAAQKKELAKFEGLPIAVEGFLALVKNQGVSTKQGARPEGKESCNCDSEAANEIDFHLWLLKNAEDDRTNSIVVEISPRVRAKHPRWILKDLTFIAAKKFPVRISGWLMFDGQHPEQIGKTRGTLWEVHPIMKIEYQKDGVWTTL